MTTPGSERRAVPVGAQALDLISLAVVVAAVGLAGAAIWESATRLQRAPSLAYSDSPGNIFFQIGLLLFFTVGALGLLLVLQAIAARLDPPPDLERRETQRALGRGLFYSMPVLILVSMVVIPLVTYRRLLYTKEVTSNMHRIGKAAVQYYFEGNRSRGTQ